VEVGVLVQGGAGPVQEGDRAETGISGSARAVPAQGGVQVGWTPIVGPRSAKL